MTAAIRPRVCFFVGPSVPADTMHAACAIIPADVSILPPVEQGDLLKLLTDLPDIVGIIDGFFFQTPSVLHKEILMAMERGVRVLGAASLGALRAAELDVFGMEGVGTIYNLYRRGVIDGDHEVAVLHAEPSGGFRPLSEPLVNVRHNLERARRQRVISARAARALLATAQRLFFSELTYEAMLAGAPPDQVSAEEAAALRQFLREHAVDLKRQDALGLVRTVAARLGGAEAWPPQPPLTAHVTRYFGDYLRAYVGRPVGEQHVPDRLVLGLAKLLDPGCLRLWQRVARRCLALDEARQRGLAPADGATLIEQFRAARSLEDDAAFAGWLRERSLAPDELAVALGERDLERRLLDQYRSQPLAESGRAADSHHPPAGRPAQEAARRGRAAARRGRAAARRGRAAAFQHLLADVSARHGMRGADLYRPLLQGLGLPWDGPLLREMKLRGAFGPALARAGQILAFTADYEAKNPNYPLSRLKRSRLESWSAARWGVAEADLPAAILDRGFATDADFDEAARHAYAWERFGG